MAAIGTAVKRRREKRGWTVYRLAQNADLSDPYVRDIEDGVSKRVGLEVGVKLARALNTTVDDLLRDAGTATGPQLLDQVRLIYEELDAPERRAFLQVGHTLREFQAEYESLQRDGRMVAEQPTAYDAELPPRTDERKAAHPKPGTREIAEASEPDAEIAE